MPRARRRRSHSLVRDLVSLAGTMSIAADYEFFSRRNGRNAEG